MHRETNTRTLQLTTGYGLAKEGDKPEVLTSSVRWDTEARWQWWCYMLSQRQTTDGLLLPHEDRLR